MQTEKAKLITAETHTLHSKLLKRDVSLSIYFPSAHTSPGEMNLLLINDGQDLEIMHFEKYFQVYTQPDIFNLFFVWELLAALIAEMSMALQSSWIIREEGPNRLCTSALFLKNCFPLSGAILRSLLLKKNLFVAFQWVA